MAHRWNSREALAARCARGARTAHASIRAQGRVPGSEANEVRRTLARQRRLMRSLDAAPACETGAPLDRGTPIVTDSASHEC